MKMKNDMEEDDGFCIKVYSPGNFIAKTINIGTLNMSGQTEQNGFNDEQVSKALLACIGDDKVINNMRKWAGAYWCLRWKCNYPVDIREFCTKIDSLKLVIPDHLKCDYDNIRRICKLSFMEYDPFGKAEVKVSSMDREVYSWCREVALKLSEELGKAYLPKL
jgi:hypothetical protein